MKCTCDNCLNNLIDNTGSERRFYVTPVITEMDFTEHPLKDTTQSIPTTLTFTLKPDNDRNIVQEFLDKAEFFWLDLETGKKYPIE